MTDEKRKGFNQAQEEEDLDPQKQVQVALSHFSFVSVDSVLQEQVKISDFLNFSIFCVTVVVPSQTNDKWKKSGHYGRLP